MALQYLKNIAIVGAGGQSGKWMTSALLKNGKHTVTAITREGSTNTAPEGCVVKKVDYNNKESLVEAMKGQDVLIITMAVTAPPESQNKLIDAAAEASIPWILPNEFGADGLNEGGGRDNYLGTPKKAVRDHIESLGKSSWIGICCGFWYEFSLGGGMARYGFDFKKKEILFFDDGATRLNTSTWPQVGRAVANLLALPVKTEDGSPSLEQYKNNFVYISSFTINQKEMFDSVLRVTGEKAKDWKTSSRPTKELYREGVEELKGGNRIGFVKLLYTRSFFDDKFGLPEETKGLDNDKLSLPKEDLDEFTKEAVRLAESGYFAFEGH